MRTCVVCGARVRNINQKANTCGSLCTKARNAGRTREGQIRHEMDLEPWVPLQLKAI